MGAIGSSVSAIFPFGGWTEALDAVNEGRLDRVLDVIEDRGKWWVLTGDQVLFSSQNIEECGGFVLGVIMGSVMFADPPLYP